MPIVPDDKDWTWVLDRPCPECGADVSTMAATAVAGAIRDNAGAWRRLLDHDDVRRRPTDDRWSALEYACHVRDVYRLYLERLQLMLERDDPTFPNWDQDTTAVDERYGEQDPQVVTGDLEAASARLADAFDDLRPEQWPRTGARNDGAEFTVDTFSRYLLHDPIHHLWDVRRGYAMLRDADPPAT